MLTPFPDQMINDDDSSPHSTDSNLSAVYDDVENDSPGDQPHDIKVARQSSAAADGSPMPIPPLDSSTGCLPLGRHHCTVSEFEAYFVNSAPFDESQRRKEIWSHWTRACAVLPKVVPVYAAWISGSFITAKLEPDDMDIVFVIDGQAAEVLAATQPARAPLLAAFGRGKQGHTPAGRRLDTYLVHWKPILSPGDTLSDAESSYYHSRGHWDDFWQRRRSGTAVDPIQLVETTPRRGYLEVKLGDYPQ